MDKPQPLNAIYMDGDVAAADHVRVRFDTSAPMVGSWSLTVWTDENENTNELALKLPLQQVVFLRTCSRTDGNGLN